MAKGSQMAKFATSGPTPKQQPSLTDTYFKHTRHIVQANGDCEVTYAVFMRRPVTFAGRLAIDWITAMAVARQAELKIEQLYVEGAWIGAGEPICYITGPFSVLVDLETIFLQRLGQPVWRLITLITCVLNCQMLPFWLWMRAIVRVMKWLN